MKKIYKFLFQFFPFSKEQDSVVLDNRSFFDYSSSERIKIMRAAGREAQKEQRKLLKAYEARFGQT